MKSSSEDKAEGKVHEVKGGIKEAAGDMTSDADLEAEGASEKAEGKIQQKVGDVKKVFGK